MKRRGRRVGAPTVILLTVFIIVAGIVIMNYFATRNVESSHIVLPKDTDATVQSISGQPEDFILVTRENVVDVVASLSRPTAYHQSLSEVITDGDVLSETLVDLWVCGNVMQISSASADTVRHILTDGQSIYIWYDGNPHNVVKSDLLPGVTMDDLAGVPTYEGLCSVSLQDILDAAYVQLDTPADNPCVFVKTRRSENESELDWIDTASGLLCRAEYERAGKVFGSVEQILFETIDASEVAVQSVFYLPDGSEPFSISSALETQPA